MSCRSLYAASALISSQCYIDCCCYYCLAQRCNCLVLLYLAQNVWLQFKQLVCKINGLAHRLSFRVTSIYKNKVGCFNGTLFVDNYSKISGFFWFCVHLVGWMIKLCRNSVYLFKSVPHYKFVYSFQDWKELWLDEAFWHILFWE